MKHEKSQVVDWPRPHLFAKAYEGSLQQSGCFFLLNRNGISSFRRSRSCTLCLGKRFPLFWVCLPLIVMVDIGNHLLPGELPPLKLLVSNGREPRLKIHPIGALMPECFSGRMIIKFPVCHWRPDDNRLIEESAGKSPPSAFFADFRPQSPFLLKRPQFPPSLPRGHALKRRLCAAVQALAGKGISENWKGFPFKVQGILILADGTLTKILPHLNTTPRETYSASPRAGRSKALPSAAAKPCLFCILYGVVLLCNQNIEGKGKTAFTPVNLFQEYIRGFICHIRI